MQARSRFLALAGLAAVAGIAVTVGFLARQSEEDAAATVAIAPPPPPPRDVETAGVGPAVGPQPTEDVTPAPRDARMLVRDARGMLEEGHAADAEAAVQEALALGPETASAWNVLGRAQLAQGRTADAESSFVTACNLDSTYAWARNNLGWLYLQRGAWAEAAAELETAVRLRDGIASFHNNLACAYEGAGRLADAAREYGRALAMQPEHATARIALARVERGQPSPLAAAPGDSTAALGKP